MRSSTPRRLSGFTLLELMIAVVVAGILAAIAYPSLVSFLQRSRRADAIAVLTSIVQTQERYRSNKTAYASTFTELGITNIGTASRYYDFALAGISESFVTGYQVTATLKASSAQAGDTGCSTLGIKLDGGLFTYLATDSSQNDTSATCWSR